MFKLRDFDKEIKNINKILRNLKKEKKQYQEELILLEKKEKRLSSCLAVLFGANKSKSYKECEKSLENLRKGLNDLNSRIDENTLLKDEINNKYNEAVELYFQALKKGFDEVLLQQSAELGYSKAVEYFEEKEAKRLLREEKKRLREEEKRRNNELEARFQKIISSEKIDRDELRAIADLGHIKSKIEVAKLLIDDYFSNIYTAKEKRDIIGAAHGYLYDFQNEGDEREFLYRFCDSVFYKGYQKGLQKNLERIREIKSAGILSQKYEELAEKVIRKIVEQIDELELQEKEKHQTKEESASYYSYSTNKDDDSSLCAHYQNGCCKHGNNANYNNISCGYQECFHSVCPHYQRR